MQVRGRMPLVLQQISHHRKLPKYGFYVVLSISMRVAGHISVGDGRVPGSCHLQLHRCTNSQAQNCMGAPVCVQGLKRGLRLIDAAMAELKGTPAEGQVSTADMIALAGAYAVSKTGGPKIEVPVGECLRRCCRHFKWVALTPPPKQLVDSI